MTSLLAVLPGAAGGAVLIGLMQREGMLQSRSGLAILLICIAVFYPVFAFAENDLLAAAVHSAVFLAFVALAIRAHRRGTFLLAGGLIAHGIFDIAIGFINAPGPTWWPGLCAAFDITAGVLVLRLIQTGKVPA